MANSSNTTPLPSGVTERLDPYRVRIKPHADHMRTDGRVFADKRLWRAIRKDLTLSQVANVAALPGIVGPAMAMPDAHQGYGFPIGGVAATDIANGGVVSPGGVGFDINCGVRLLATEHTRQSVSAQVLPLVESLFKRIPVGFGKNRKRLSGADMAGLLQDGAAWVVAQGMGTDDDLEHAEEGGRMRSADPSQVSDKARKRGAGQLGTLGSGNHFVELQWVDEVLEPAAAEAFGLSPDQVVVLVHTGSRGLGHQVCTEHVRSFRDAMHRYDIRLPDQQLACAPVSSPEGQAYLGAMAGAANFAWGNRQLITHRVRQAFTEVMGPSPMRVVYDVAHNIAKVEQHTVNGAGCALCVHRKGATRAFPAGHPDLPTRYSRVGQPVFIPGSMGTSSYVMVGTQRAMEETWGSVCHGAGRAMSRKAARKATNAKQVVDALKRQDIVLRAGSTAGIVEEFPGAYKDITNVIDVVTGAGLARPVARLKPMGVVKG